MNTLTLDLDLDIDNRLVDGFYLLSAAAIIILPLSVYRSVYLAARLQYSSPLPMISLRLPDPVVLSLPLVPKRCIAYRGLLIGGLVLARRRLASPAGRTAERRFEPLANQIWWI